MAIDKKYLEEAKEMLSGGLTNQKVQMQNSFNQNVQALEGQKAGVNQNFDNQLTQNARNTVMSQNQYGNNSLARGLGRSTIATSGQAGIQDRGNRISNEVEGQRVTAMGNIESQKVQLQQALQNSLLGLEAQQSSDSLNLARQLEEMAYNRDFQGQQFEFTKEQDAYNRDFQGQQFEFTKEQAVADRDFRNAQFEYQKAQDILTQALEREKFGYTKEADKARQDFAQAQFDFEKSQQAWDNAFKEKQFAFQKSSTGGSGGSSSGGSRSSSGSSGGNYSESQMWSEFNTHLAADLKNGSYESGRFVQKIAKQNPGAAKEMQKLYDEARKKRGNTPKQSVKSKTSNNSYQSQ